MYHGCIGNRATSEDPDGPAKEYNTNELNQYEHVGVTTPLANGGLKPQYDADGNLIEEVLAGDMNCDGSVNASDIDCFTAAINGQCPPDPPNYPCDPCPCLNGDLNGDGAVNWRDIDYFTAAQGTYGGARYTWNAENRLVAVEPISHGGGAQRVEFAYDYQGRRVAKRVYDWDPGDPNDPNDDDWATTPCACHTTIGSPANEQLAR